MAQNETWLNHDLLDAVKVQYLDGNLFSMDNAGNLIGVKLTRDGVDYSGGGSVSANVIRADGGTVAVVGALSGNTATVILPQSAYAVPGVVSIVVKLTVSGEVTTIAAVVANVYQSSTDSAIDPGTIIPSVQNLISAIQAAVASIPADYSSLWTSLAPEFSTSTNYTAGQYVTYNGAVYRFTTDHLAGAWNSAHVVVTNIGSDITDLKSALRTVNELDLITGGNRTNETVNTVDFTWNEDKTACTVNGTNSSSTSLAINLFLGSSTTIPDGFTPGETYFVSANSTNEQIKLGFYFFVNGTYSSAQTFSSEGTLTIPSNTTGMTVFIGLKPGQTANNDVISGMSVQKNNYVKDISELKSELKSALDTEPIIPITWEQGRLSAQGMAVNSDYAIRSKDFIPADSNHRTLWLLAGEYTLPEGAIGLSIDIYEYSSTSPVTFVKHTEKSMEVRKSQTFTFDSTTVAFKVVISYKTAATYVINPNVGNLISVMWNSDALPKIVYDTNKTANDAYDELYNRYQIPATWEQGRISTEGVDVDSTYAIRSKGYIKVDTHKMVSALFMNKPIAEGADNIQINVFEYSSINPVTVINRFEVFNDSKNSYQLNDNTKYIRIVEQYIPAGTITFTPEMNVLVVPIWADAAEITGNYVCNVKQFGAKGDGVTDDTEALNNAIRYGSRIVYFPPGVYMTEGINTEYLINKTLIGYGATLRSNVVKRRVSRYALISNYPNGRTFSDSNFNGYVKIYGLTLDGNKAIYDMDDPNNRPHYITGLGISLAKYESVVIKDCTILNTVNAGVSTWACNNVIIDNCRLIDISIEWDAGLDYIWDAIEIGAWLTVNGTEIYKLCRFAIITNCQIYRSVGGAISAASREVTISNNYIEDNGGMISEDGFERSSAGAQAINQTFVRNITNNVFNRFNYGYSSNNRFKRNKLFINFCDNIMIDYGGGPVREYAGGVYGASKNKFFRCITKDYSSPSPCRIMFARNKLLSVANGTYDRGIMFDIYDADIVDIIDNEFSINFDLFDTNSRIYAKRLRLSGNHINSTNTFTKCNTLITYHNDTELEKDVDLLEIIDNSIDVGYDGEDVFIAFSAATEATTELVDAVIKGNIQNGNMSSFMSVPTGNIEKLLITDNIMDSDHLINNEEEVEVEKSIIKDNIVGTSILSDDSVPFTVTVGTIANNYPA